MKTDSFIPMYSLINGLITGKHLHFGSMFKHKTILLRFLTAIYQPIKLPFDVIFIIIIFIFCYYYFVLTRSYHCKGVSLGVV